MTIKTIPAHCAETDLERAALDWLNEQGEDYKEDGASGAAKDLFYGGCQSGIVGMLIYSADCEAFAKQHLSDILSIIDTLRDETGEMPQPRNGMMVNCDWLAWLGFEEAARVVCNRAGIDA